MVPTNEELKQRLYNRTVLSDEESCWLWVGAANTKGYGNINIGGATHKAHRISYTAHIGAIPDGLHVLHACDTPSCINPSHLFTGTHAQNMEDMARKGRRLGIYNGERCRSAKLTSDQVRAIHAQRAKGETESDLASFYGVSYQSIHSLLIGKTWAHIYKEITA